jgi:hypothetical protein
LIQVPESTLPSLIEGVTPFLFWASPPGHPETLAKDFEARAAVAESELKHTHTDNNYKAPMDLFHASFDQDIYGDMAEMDDTGLQNLLRVFKSTHKVEQQTLSAVSGYFDHITLVLETFMPKDSHLTLAKKLYGALAMTMDVSYVLSSYPRHND